MGGIFCVPACAVGTDVEVAREIFVVAVALDVGGENLISRADFRIGATVALTGGLTVIKKAIKYFLIFCVICGVASALTGGGQHTSQPAAPKATAPAPKQYAAVDANALMAELERNAAAASKRYKGQSVCVSGRVGVIDSNGDYILLQSDNEFAITGVMCYLNSRDKSQEDFLMSVSNGQYIRAYGTIDDVGEVIGYSLKVDKFSN